MNSATLDMFEVSDVPKTSSCFFVFQNDAWEISFQNQNSCKNVVVSKDVFFVYTLSAAQFEFLCAVFFHQGLVSPAAKSG